jgi:hypothetical protein
MWTTENRPRYDRDRLRYPSDLTDAEWQPVTHCMGIQPDQTDGTEEAVS